MRNTMWNNIIKNYTKEICFVLVREQPDVKSNFQNALIRWPISNSHKRYF